MHNNKEMHNNTLEPIIQIKIIKRKPGCVFWWKDVVSKITLRENVVYGIFKVGHNNLSLPKCPFRTLILAV